jgi:hypothetical protein
VETTYHPRENEFHSLFSYSHRDSHSSLVSLFAHHGNRSTHHRLPPPIVTPTDDVFRHVSSHNLRRRYAQRLLVDENMSPRVVMQVGGWASFQAIGPSLNLPTETVVDDEFAGGEVVWHTCVYNWWRYCRSDGHTATSPDSVFLIGQA